MPRFAANLSMMFNEWPFLDRFAAAADAGFDAVEFLFPYEYRPTEIADRLHSNGLQNALFNLQPGNWAGGERGLAALPDRRAEFQASVELALEYAAALKTRSLHMMAGIASSATHKAGDSYRQALRFAAEAARPYDVDIMIEPINHRDMPGYFLNDFRLAREIINELALPNVRLQFDIYHRQIIQGDILRGLEELMPLIGHVQIASVPERHEPGTGELDDFHLFAALDTLGYNGFVGCEYRPLAGTVEGLRWRERLPADFNQ